MFPAQDAPIVCGARCRTARVARSFVPPPRRRHDAVESIRTSTHAAAERTRAAVKAMEPEDTEGKVAHVGLVLSAVGLCLVLFVAYVFVFTGLQEARAQHLLLEQFTGPARANVDLSSHLKEGQPAALLVIPSIGLHLVVVKGTSATDLMSGPGLMANTALPGTNGNAVIAGRRSTGGRRSAASATFIGVIGSPSSPASGSSSTGSRQSARSRPEESIPSPPRAGRG